MKATLSLIFAAITFSLQLHAEESREEFDFNFDGHADYRVKTLENGKADRYDVFIFDPDAKKFVKDPILSGTISPQPDASSKEIRCVWPGGHSGNIFSSTIYKWTGKAFKLDRTVRQEALVVNEKVVYVRVEARLENGIPQITSIEPR